MAWESTSDGEVALLSIRPEYARAILDGTKTVEFRRVPFRRKVSHVVIYATSPVSEVVGGFSVRAIHKGSPKAIWTRFGGMGGISWSVYSSYYRGSEVAVAIEIESAAEYKAPYPLGELGLTRPPQSFAYLERLENENLASPKLADRRHLPNRL